MYRAIGVEPTKLTAWTVGWTSSASTASLSPWTTLNTPSGSPASARSSASSRDAEGSFSDGLRTKVFPHTRAFGNIQSGTMAGKLNGVIPATTPRGCSTECTSTPVATWWLIAPFSRCGAPQANSTFSMPRCTSPAASESTFPCSAVIAAARSPRWATRSSRKRNMISARRANDTSRHVVNASAAMRTTRSTSAALAKGTEPVTAPVAGSNTSPLRSEPSVLSSCPPVWGAPPIQ